MLQEKGARLMEEGKDAGCHTCNTKVQDNQGRHDGWTQVSKRKS